MKDQEKQESHQKALELDYPNEVEELSVLHQ